MPKNLPAWRRRLVDAARIGDLLVRDIAVGQLTLRAMSLVYTSLLSLVPLIAVSFSVLKAFGAHNHMEPFLLNLFLPLGERGPTLATEIIGFVDNIQVGVLGSLGLVFLLYMVVSLIQKLEAAFNEIWHVPADRHLIQRAANYLAVLLVGPVLMFTAMGSVASLMASDAAQWLMRFELLEFAYAGLTALVPYLFVTAAFAFIYLFIPNTRVRFVSAVIGAAFAGFAWATVGWMFARFVAASTQYTAIYSGFAIVIVAMIWVYIAWLILLAGASIAYYHQYRGELRLRGIDSRLGGRMREVLALMIMRNVGRRFYQGGAPLTADGLAMELGAPRPELALVINALVRADLLAPASEPPGAFLPGRPLDTTRVDCVLKAVREDPGERADAVQAPVAAEVPAFVSALMDGVERATRDVCSEWTLKRLALEDEPDGASEPASAEASPNPRTRSDGEHAPMKIRSSSFADGQPIPPEFALCAPDRDAHVAMSSNRSPHLAWSDVPPDARSLVLVCCDPDAPSRPDDVNQEDRTVPAALPRANFFHWVLVDLPPDLRELAAGADSDGVTAGGKRDATGPAGSRRGINDYTAWFTGDADMEGRYHGYDGPCPPWNDEVRHRYVFTVHALDIARCPVDGAFDAEAVLEAIKGHVLAHASITGTYSMNPDVPA